MAFRPLPDGLPIKPSKQAIPRFLWLSRWLAEVERVTVDFLPERGFSQILAENVARKLAQSCL
jgi:hypothetical protein